MCQFIKLKQSWDIPCYNEHDFLSTLYSLEESVGSLFFVHRKSYIMPNNIRMHVNTRSKLYFVNWHEMESGGELWCDCVR